MQCLARGAGFRHNLTLCVSAHIYEQIISSNNANETLNECNEDEKHFH